MNIDLLPAIFIVILVATVGSTIQRVTGFGFGIFAMLFLTRIITVYGEANALSGLLSFTSTLIVALSHAKKVDWKNLLFPCIGFAVISVPSILLMKKLDNRVLLIMLGVALILLSGYMFFFSSKIKIKPSPFTGLAAGGFSGILGGIFSMGGPPVVIYFMQSEGDDKDRYLATIQMYFLLSNVYGTAVKAINGFITKDVLILAAFGTVGMIAGIFIGKLIFKKLRVDILRRVVYCFMAVAGVVNIVSAILK